ncbi:hypothetical protein NQ318_007179 [Aromia moschata]|uniref:DUF4817 domain-containing protein n=1 Tax=Aromia moschata TaxID=1265417 RepID=A0AAV8XMI4_9CUCU|nr:hypothetical protein NQ318_007179 [Aromia moschata]
MLRVLSPFYGRHDGPSKSTLQRLVATLETTGSINNLPPPVRQRNARSAENIAAVGVSVQENPRQPIPRRLHPYKIQLIQEIKVNDHRQRRLFADWASERLEENPNFVRRPPQNPEEITSPLDNSRESLHSTKVSFLPCPSLERLRNVYINSESEDQLTEVKEHFAIANLKTLFKKKIRFGKHNWTLLGHEFLP